MHDFAGLVKKVAHAWELFGNPIPVSPLNACQHWLEVRS